ncbi:MAG TPA: ABC transporter substrate-binding protein [Methylomirabilota bacterium]|nr:ABC transporter substrate-binding protein [Methylomirabilota bacterium]
MRSPAAPKTPSALFAGGARRKWSQCAAGWLALFVICCSAPAAQAQKIYSIGSLNTADQFINAFASFKVRMAELGYREGHNVRYQHYNAKGDSERLRGAANKLAEEKVDLIVTSSTTATVAAAKAAMSARIPVLFLSAGNPEKLVQSFAGFGNNLAGISSASLELTGKRFELLRELAPRAKRVAMPLNPKGVSYSDIVSEARQTAAKLGFEIAEVHVTAVDEMASVIPTITRKSYDAIFHPPDSLVTEGVEVVANQAVKEKLPVVTSLLVNVKRGCLATYAADYLALGRQGAVLADKILKGAHPAELPIELPDKFKLALNLKTAKAIGLRISKEMLLRADEVVE